MKKITLFLCVSIVLLLVACAGNDQVGTADKGNTKENEALSNELKETLSETYDIAMEDIMFRDEIEDYIQTLLDDADEEERKLYENKNHLEQQLEYLKGRLVAYSNSDMGFVDPSLDMEDNEQLMNKHVSTYRSLEDNSYNQKINDFYGYMLHLKEIYNPSESRIAELEEELKALDEDEQELYLHDINSIDANINYNHVDDYIADLRDGGISLTKSFGHLSRLTHSEFNENSDETYLVKDTKGFKEYAEGIYLGYPFITTDYEGRLHLEMLVYIPENHDLEETEAFFDRFADVSINGSELMYEQHIYDTFTDNVDLFTEYGYKNILLKDSVFTVGLYMQAEDLWDEGELPSDVDISSNDDIRFMMRDGNVPDATLDINGERLVLDERISKEPVDHNQVSNLYEIKNNFNIEAQIIEN